MLTCVTILGWMSWVAVALGAGGFIATSIPILPRHCTTWCAGLSAAMPWHVVQLFGQMTCFTAAGRNLVSTFLTGMPGAERGEWQLR